MHASSTMNGLYRRVRRGRSKLEKREHRFSNETQMPLRVFGILQFRREVFHLRLQGSTSHTKFPAIVVQKLTAAAKFMKHSPITLPVFISQSGNHSLQIFNP